MDALSVIALGLAAQGGGGGTEYTAGDGIAINSDNEISALIDGETIQFNEDGELTAVGGSTEVPTITPTLSQVISIDPLTVQFTTEQSAILEDENVVDILFKLSNLGKNDCYFKKNATVASDNLIILHCWYGGESKKDVRISYYTDNKRGVYSEVNCGGTEVSGTNDGINWTSLTIDDDTYAIPSGGSSSYTAGDGITIENNEISVDDDYIKQIPVNGAYQLISNDGQIVEGEFISRTTAGDASITTGNASRIYLRGNSENNTKVDASVELVNAENATVDIATYIAYAESQGDATGTKVFTEDDANYGIALNGDESATASYVAKNDGTIINATPTGMISTGFNQYNHTTGKAYIIEGNRYQIFGTYTSVGGEVIEDNVQVNSYTIPHSFVASMTGEVIVTGGNSTDTMIALVWSGYNYNHEYVAYNTDTVAITDVTGWGMPRVNGVYDEIDFENQQYIKRIGRDVVANKDLYDNKIYDSTYVYYVIGEDIKSSISISNTYLADDFGQEIFTGTNVPVGLVVLYGNNLKDKLRTDVLTLSQQTLTEAQFNQVMSNLQLGAAKHSSYLTVCTLSDMTGRGGFDLYYFGNISMNTIVEGNTYIVEYTVDNVDYSEEITAINIVGYGGLSFTDQTYFKQFYWSGSSYWLSVNTINPARVSKFNITSLNPVTTYTSIDSNLLPKTNIIYADSGSSKSINDTTIENSQNCFTYGKSNSIINNTNSVLLGNLNKLQALGNGSDGNALFGSGNEFKGRTITCCYGIGANNIVTGHSTDFRNIFLLGRFLKSESSDSFVIGKYNALDATKAFSIGNGTSDSARSNALTVDWNGNLVCNNIPAPPSADGNYVLKCSIVDGTPSYSWVEE